MRGSAVDTPLPRSTSSEWGRDGDAVCVLLLGSFAGDGLDMADIIGAIV